MKTPTTNLHSATSRFFDASRTVRGLAIACTLFCAALAAQSASAACPPGYAPKGPGCEPTPPHPYHPGRELTEHSNVPSSATANHLQHKPIEVQKEVDWRKVKPQPGAPIEHHSSASEKHGNMVVGGHSGRTLDKAALNTQPIPPGHSLAHDKAAINSQPVPPGHEKQMLNPQPIPPGHALRKLPPPGAPIESIGH